MRRRRQTASPKPEEKFFLLRFDHRTGKVVIDYQSLTTKIPARQIIQVLLYLAKWEPEASYVAVPLRFATSLIRHLAKIVKDGKELPN